MKVFCGITIVEERNEQNDILTVTTCDPNLDIISENCDYGDTWKKKKTI